MMGEYGLMTTPAAASQVEVPGLVCKCKAKKEKKSQNDAYQLSISTYNLHEFTNINTLILHLAQRHIFLIIILISFGEGSGLN
jgi:hypothetical protein